MSTPKCINVYVALGNGRVPDWKLVIAKSDWKLKDFIKVTAETLNINVSNKIALYNVELRMAKVIAVQMLEEGDKVLVVPEGGHLIPYGVVACGSNEYGQLGMENGLEINVVMPTVIPTLCNLQILQVSCGEDHTLALTKEGQVLSFGNASNGRLGHGIVSSSDSTALTQRLPKRIELPNCARGIFVSCGKHFSIVVSSEDVVSFGAQGPWLGIADKQGDVWSPERIELPDSCKFVSVSCGVEHVLALDDQGNAYSWGIASDGKLGYIEDRGGPGFMFRTKEQMQDLFSDAQEAHVGLLVEGLYFKELLNVSMLDPDQKCYVSKIEHIDLVDVCQFSENVLVGVQDALSGDPVDFDAISSRESRWIYVRSANDKTIATHKPRRVKSLGNIKAVAAGAMHSLFLDNDGRMFACGDNHDGQLGMGGQFMSATNFASSVPVRIKYLEGGVEIEPMIKISCGYHHNVAIGMDGKLYSWGNEELVGRHGDPYIPAAVLYEENPLCFVQHAACGKAHTVCCTQYGHGFGYGEGDHGQLGCGGRLHQALPQRLVSSNESVRNDKVYISKGDGTKTSIDFESTDPRSDTSLMLASVSAGGAHSIFLLGSQVDEDVWAWTQKGPGTNGGGTNTNTKRARDLCVGIDTENLTCVLS